MDDKKYEQMKSEFVALCTPLLEWFQKNGHPHAKIIIEQDGAEYVEGFMAMPFEVKG